MAFLAVLREGVTPTLAVWWAQTKKKKEENVLMIRSIEINRFFFFDAKYKNNALSEYQHTAHLFFFFKERMRHRERERNT